MIVDLFAGPGGWSEACKQLGRHDEIGIEFDTAACMTRAAAGHLTIQADVATYPKRQFGVVDGIIASPPCQDFSNAGKRAGRTGAKGELIDTVPEWVDWLSPDWVVCEQVPPALPIWHEHAETYREFGYSVWVGILNSADYGVPQTRKRAILIASRKRPAVPPKPTHAKRPRFRLDGDSELPWVSMAEALGWHGRVGFPRLDDLGTSEDGYRERDWRDTEQPSFALTEKARSWVVDRRNQESDGAGGRRPVVPVSVERPAPSLTGKSGQQWVFRAGAMEHAAVRSIDEPAPTIIGAMDNGDAQWELREWPWESPATTVTGDPRISARNHHEAGEQSGNAQSTNAVRDGDYDGQQPIKLTLQEAAILQSFRPDYPFTGTKTKQFEQVGNAIPVGLAKAILQCVVPL